MVREYLDSLIVAGLVALLLISFVIRTYYIPSISMVPTLDVRDVVLVDELTYRFGGPAAGRRRGLHSAGAGRGQRLHQAGHRRSG